MSCPPDGSNSGFPLLLLRAARATALRKPFATNQIAAFPQSL